MKTSRVAGNIGGRSICTDLQGKSYVVGNFSSTNLILDSTTFQNHELYNSFLLKFKSTGNSIWAKLFGNARNDECNAISMGEDNLYSTIVHPIVSIQYLFSMQISVGYNKLFIPRYF